MAAIIPADSRQATIGKRWEASPFFDGRPMQACWTSTGIRIRSKGVVDDRLDLYENLRNELDIFEGVSAAKAARAELEVAEPVEAEAKEEVAGGSEDVELDLTPGVLDKTSDPVRVYLREMGSVPLLKREGEVVIAKRIEHGQLLVLKTI